MVVVVVVVVVAAIVVVVAAAAVSRRCVVVAPTVNPEVFFFNLSANPACLGRPIRAASTRKPPAELGILGFRRGFVDYRVVIAIF